LVAIPGRVDAQTKENQEDASGGVRGGHEAQVGTSAPDWTLDPNARVKSKAETTASLATGNSRMGILPSALRSWATTLHRVEYAVGLVREGGTFQPLVETSGRLMIHITAWLRRQRTCASNGNGRRGPDHMPLCEQCSAVAGTLTAFEGVTPADYICAAF
jgi:hypothetical protein